MQFNLIEVCSLVVWFALAQLFLICSDILLTYVLLLCIDGPKNLAITPVKESYKLGDKLICYAYANPTPVYEWKDMTTYSRLTTGPDFTIQSFISSFIVECTASNTFGSNSGSVIINLSSGKLLLKISLFCYVVIMYLYFYFLYLLKIISLGGFHFISLYLFCTIFAN